MPKNPKGLNQGSLMLSITTYLMIAAVFVRTYLYYPEVRIPAFSLLFLLVILLMIACSNTDSLPQPVVAETEAVNTGRESIFVDMYDIPMALVPAGLFEMGSEDGTDDEQPVHTVFLSAFYIDVYEVTNEQYRRCVAAGECSESGYADDSRHNGDNQPVVPPDALGKNISVLSPDGRDQSPHDPGKGQGMQRLPCVDKDCRAR